MVDPASRIIAALPRMSELEPEIAAQARGRLEDPVRVAIVGGVSAGKSTLVNALLGVPVAPTGTGETTRLPCWFRHGRYTTASVVDGERRAALTLEGDRLPLTLPSTVAGWPRSPNLRCEITLATRVLRRMRLIDTAGLDSSGSNADNLLVQESTMRCLANADAILFVTAEANDETLAGLRTLISDSRITPRTPLIVALTRCDTRAGDLDKAMRLGASISEDFQALAGGLVRAVVAVTGLLASTGRSGVVTESHLRALRALACDIAEDDQELMLSDVRLLDGVASQVPVAKRRELVSVLGLSGLGWCLERCRRDPEVTSQGLCDGLVSRSGLVGLSKALTQHVLQREGLVKASSVLNLLQQAADEPSTSLEFCSAVADLTADPELIDLAVQRAGDLADQTRVPLPAALRQELAHAISFGVHGLEREPEAAASDWRRWQLIADGVGKAAAATMIRAHQIRATGGIR